MSTQELSTSNVPEAPSDSKDENNKGGSKADGRKRGSTAADITVSILSALREVSQAAGGIGYAGMAAAIALEIVNAAQGAKDNKVSFKTLALDAGTLVLNIAEVCKEFEAEKEISPLLRRHLDTLEETLKQIRDYAKKRGDKAYWKRYISSRSDLDRIKEFRERLNQAVDLFGVQSHITVRESIARMATRQETIHEELKRKESDIPQRTSPETVPIETTASPTSVKSNNPFLSGSTPSAAPTPSPQFSFNDAFGDLLTSSVVTGSITVNNISGNSQVVTNNNSKVRKNIGNVYNTTTVNSNNTFVGPRGHFSPTMASENVIEFYDIPSKLPGIAWSPNTWKTRYCLNYKGLPYKTIWVEYPDIEATCKRLGVATYKRDGTPYYTLPVIHDPSTGKSIANSPLIAEYLDETYPDTPKLFPPGTRSLQTVFQHAIEWDHVENLDRFVLPQVASILNPRSYEFFNESRSKWYKVDTVADMYPKGEEKIELWNKWKDEWGAVDKWMKDSETLLVMEDTITWADFVVAGWVIWCRCIWGEDSEEWKEIGNIWQGGRWGKLLKRLSEYETVV
ncbi:hypothetical protein PQX77_000735 [Marasmius sp. AFHP31]|nr:hypothetical protein PQX77_000735 [Marasmius sp. AFHP31]